MLPRRVTTPSFTSACTPVYVLITELTEVLNSLSGLITTGASVLFSCVVASFLFLQETGAVNDHADIMIMNNHLKFFMFCSFCWLLQFSIYYASETDKLRSEEHTS